MNSLQGTKLFFGVLFACMMLMGQLAYAGIAGNVQFANGDVRVANSAGQTHALQKSDVIHESDTVITAKNGSAQIKLRDGGFIAVRPNSKLKFDSFVFNGEQDGTERGFFTLLQGGARAITGLVGQLHKANYRIKTPASTIGIRGTDHEIVVVVPGSEMAEIVPLGTYNKVNVGETMMTTDKGTINILPNQMGFVGAMDQMPQLQPINLNIFTVNPAPLPQAKGGGDVRDGSVVDSELQDQNTVPGNAPQGNSVRTPLKGDAGTISPKPVVF
jgi:FecR protein